MQTGMIYLGGPVLRTAGLTARQFALVLLLVSTIPVFDILRKTLFKPYGPVYNGNRLPAPRQESGAD